MLSSIPTSDLKKMIGRVNIIGIRDNYLYKLGSIPTSRNIPMNFLLTNPEDYLKQDETYYVYCSKGLQSARVCTTLANRGYNVVNCLGGYNEYISKY